MIFSPLEAKIAAAAARGVAEALENDMEAVIATKTDLQYLRTQMGGDMQALKTEVQAEIKALKVEMDHRFDATDDRFERLELRLTVKLGTFLALAVGLIVTLQQVLA